MRRTLAALTATACLVVVAGCGDVDTGSSDGTAAPSSGASGKIIQIDFQGDSVSPNGDRVEVKAGERIELDVTADVAGEIHVHSSPEQELEYGAGNTSLPLTIDQPGIVEVESHALNKVIVQLEVTP